MLGFFVFTLALSFTQALYFENRAACSSHPDYPNTFQCGISQRCISITQYHDGKLDCCDPTQAACHDYTDEAVYFSSGPQRNTLEKPGSFCYGHPSYPNTIQCAYTKRCIDISKYRDGHYDCCGPNNNTCPEDQSDEDRIDPPGVCNGPNDYTVNGISMTFQCATTKLCLSMLEQPNGKCDCCGPTYDCSNCTDQSDEDPCRPQNWPLAIPGQTSKEKFSCAGTCRDISQLTDNVLDCPYQCVEPTVRDQCRQNLQQQQVNTAQDWCNKLDAKTTPYFTCMAMGTTAQIDVCVEPSKVRDGKYECDDGSDESTEYNPDCSAEEKATYCTDATTQCVKINNMSGQIDCRCNTGAGGQSCFKSGSGRKRK